MISNFPMMYTFREFFLDSFFRKCNILLYVDVTFNTNLLTLKYFSFRKQLYILHTLLKRYKHIHLFFKLKIPCQHK